MVQEWWLKPQEPTWRMTLNPPIFSSSCIMLRTVERHPFPTTSVLTVDTTLKQVMSGHQVTRRIITAFPNHQQNSKKWGHEDKKMNVQKYSALQALHFWGTKKTKPCLMDLLRQLGGVFEPSSLRLGAVSVTRELCAPSSEAKPWTKKGFRWADFGDCIAGFSLCFSMILKQNKKVAFACSKTKRWKWILKYFEIDTTNIKKKWGRPSRKKKTFSSASPKRDKTVLRMGLRVFLHHFVSWCLENFDRENHHVDAHVIKIN